MNFSTNTQYDMCDDINRKIGITLQTKDTAYDCFKAIEDVSLPLYLKSLSLKTCLFLLKFFRYTAALMQHQITELKMYCRVI